MWSGPRNISTAMMRAFENRSDTVVVDEPFYAHYLLTTGLPHPGADEVLAAQDNDWRRVAKTLSEAEQGADVFYQKHMAHHFCGSMDLSWIGGLTHGFLLREPRAMLLSLSRVLDEVTVADTGLEQQKRLFDELRRRGLTPPVIDARDVLEAPEQMLRALCDHLSIRFETAMLNWPAGPRDSDGVWASHWYSAVEKSTRFGPYQPVTGELDPALGAVLERCQALYDELYAHRLTI